MSQETITPIIDLRKTSVTLEITVPEWLNSVDHQHIGMMVSGAVNRFTDIGATAVASHDVSLTKYGEPPYVLPPSTLVEDMKRLREVGEWEGDGE